MNWFYGILKIEVSIMKKILYGTSHFPSMILDNGYYVDKTHYIAELENLGAKVLTFLRPRRFGKSLFVSR